MIHYSLVACWRLHFTLQDIKETLKVLPVLSALSITELLSPNKWEILYTFSISHFSGEILFKNGFFE